jgi:hypothetical protein
VGESKHDLWLFVVGLLHPAVSLSLLIAAPLAPLGMNPLGFVFLSLLLPTVVVLAAWGHGEARFSRTGVVGFLMWMAAIGYVHLRIAHEASASV